MKISGNTILITGGGTGIGRGLAEALLKEGNKVIITGRRKAKLEETVKANPGIIGIALDVDDPGMVDDVAQQIAREYPELNVLINNAGIAGLENLSEGKLDTAEAIVTTNILGPIRLTAALLPLLLKQKNAAVVNVTSGLGFLPLTMMPTYSASKAFMHSYSESLRYQLQDSKVEVKELIPPYVQTELGGERQKSDPNAMPLDEFIAEVMSILKSAPDAKEICVQRAKGLRAAESSGNYDAIFKGFNDAMKTDALAASGIEV
jgi:uncharacterized oxidoreductase